MVTEYIFVPLSSQKKRKILIYHKLVLRNLWKVVFDQNEKTKKEEDIGNET